MEDKYLQTRQKVYDLLKSEGYTDDELGGSAEILFADRSNGERAYNALLNAGYDDLGQYEDFYAKLYAPDGGGPAPMFNDEPQAVGKTRVEPSYQAPKTVQPKAENKPYVPLNLPYNGEFQPVQAEEEIQVPLAPANADEMAAENEKRRTVAKYAPGRQDDKSLYVDPSDELILDNAAKAKGYSVETAVEAGKGYEGIMAEDQQLNSDIDAFNKKWAAFEKKLASAKDGKVQVKNQQEADQFNADYSAYKQEYAALTDRSKSLSENVDALMATPAGREYNLLQDRLNALSQAEDTPENRWQAAQYRAQMSRNPIARAMMGDNAPGEAQIAFDLNRGEADYITASMETADRKKRKELKARLKELNHEVLDNSYYQADVARRISDTSAELEDVYSRMMAIRQRVMKEKSALETLDDALLAESEYKNLQLAANQLQQQKRKLEHIRDKNASDFWVNFMDVFADPNTYNLNITNLETALATAAAFKNQEMAGAGDLLAAVAGNNAVQSEEGQFVEGKGKYGQIAANSIPFMFQIGLTGGFGNMAKAVSEGAVKGVSKAVGKDLSNKLLIKATGAVLGDMAAGFVAANTIGGGKTASDFLNSYYGTLVTDADGNYQYVGGTGNVLESGWKVEVSNSAEFSSERFGDHLQHLIGRGILGAGIKAARRNGTGHVNLAVEELAKTMDVTLAKDFGIRSANQAGANWAMKAMSKVIDFSNKVGIQGLPVECVEEYVGLFENILLGGEEDWMDFSKFADPETHTDIWCGMLYSIGLTQAGTLAMGAAGSAAAGIQRAKQFHMLENGLESISAAGEELLGKEEWESVKAVVDGSSNQELPAKIIEFMRSGLFNDQQKSAILDYVKTTFIYRGFNAGTIAQARERLTNEDNLASLDIKAEVANAKDQISDAYMLGYQSTTAKREDVEQSDIDKRSKNRAIDAIEQREEIERAVERQKKRMKELTGIEDMTAEDASSLLENESIPQETKDAAIDYLMALAVERGFDDAEQNKQIRGKAALMARLEKRIGGKFYYTTPFGDSQVSTSQKLNRATGQMEPIFLLSDTPNADGTVAFISAQTGQKGFVTNDEVTDYDGNGNLVPGLVNTQSLNEYMDQQYILDQSVREAELARQDEVDTVEREAAEASQSEEERKKNARLTKEQQRAIVMRQVEANDGAIIIDGVPGSLSHETEEGATFVPDNDEMSNKPMTWEDIARKSGIASTGTAPTVSKTETVEPKPAPAPASSEIKETRDYYKPGSSRADIDQMLEDLYGNDDLLEEEVDEELIGEYNRAKKARDDAQKALDDANPEKIEKQPGETLQEVAARRKAARENFEKVRGELEQKLKDAEDELTFWAEAKKVADANIAEREEEAEREKRHQADIEKYGVDTSTLHDLDTPLTLEEAVAQYLGNSTHLINAADAEKEWLGKGNTNAGEIFRHRGQHGILTLNGGQSVKAVAEDIVGEYEDLNLDEQNVFYEILNQLNTHTKTEMRDVIFQNRLKEAIAAKEGVENAQAVPAENAVEEAPEGTEVPEAEVPESVPAEEWETTIEEQIEGAREDVDTHPTEGQKEAGNYKKGHVTIDGMDISIENPKGSIRSGKDSNGNEWQVTMNNDYGYIRLTEGVDGDHIDIFLSDKPSDGRVFVVDQVNEDGSFDEHKVMYGFNSIDEAREAYLANYSPGWKGLGAITEVSKEEFKKWIDSSHRKTKPFSEYKSVKAEETQSETPENKPQSGENKPQTPAFVSPGYTEPYHPENLREAYSSGDAAVIAEAEKAMSDYINAATNLATLDATLRQAKRRRSEAKDKESAEYKTQDFIAKTVARRIKQLEKEASANSEEAKPKDEKIEDFGEKIGGARKDTYRSKIRDSVKMTAKDLAKMKDPDKVLSRKQIAKAVADGVMTRGDAITLLAMNMAVRATSDIGDMKTLALVKYRDLAAAWERGEDLSVEITDADVDFLVNQLSDNAKARPNIRERKRESIEALMMRYFNDYMNTYDALDYPAVYRSLKSAFIRYGSADSRYWVVSSPGATRGYPFGSMEAAIAKMKALYPEVQQAGSSKNTGKDSEEGKIGALFIVKDDNGYYRIKSRSIPGKIYLSGKFYSKRSAEEHLKNNADALVEREQKMVEALLGSNIGMVQRQGPDYRKGRDVTPDEMLETFGFRGVEFGNWVPQSERQEYLNKTYDAIMDFCSVVGISPKAFSLGGRLGLAFGARGHSRALAHYEPMKEVINLTRMKGAGSLAHEWFHALDNYLAKNKTGNMSDMATSTKDVVREELSEAFRDFVNEMDSMDYSRRSRRAGDYWGEVWERAARLFENYVFNSLGENETVSPLLVRRDTLFDDVAQEGNEASAWPYPSISENEQIKPFFDRLFDTIQEETSADGKVGLYRRGDIFPGQMQEDFAGVLDGLAEALGIKYEVDNSIRGKGMFVPTTGQILVNYEAHNDVADLKATLLHEAVAHYGLRKLLGRQFHETMKQLYDGSSQAIKERVDEIAISQRLSREVAMEEYLAELAEKETFDSEEESFWQKVVDAVKSLLSKLGLAENELTEEDMKALLYASYRNLQTGGAVELAARIVTYQSLRESASESHDAASNGEGISPTGEQPLNRLREKPAPKKTKKVYKLMRRGADGKLYPLFIDSASPVELGKWYDADSPDLGMLKEMPSGVFLVDYENGTYTSLEDYKKERGEKAGKYPTKKDINEATDKGSRWVKIEDTARGQRRYEGETRKYFNLGINGSGGVSEFAMRPGWHAGSLPTMRQIGKGPLKNLRDDSFVWVEGEMSADVDYNAEAGQNPDNDIPTHVPTDGYYMKATNPNASANQQDRVGWYVGGAFKPVRVISDAEARSVIDEYNAEHPEQKPVEYDWERESGEDYTPDEDLYEVSENNTNFADNEDEVLRRAGMDSSAGNQNRAGSSDEGRPGEESGENGPDGGPRGNDGGRIVSGVRSADQGSEGPVGEHALAAGQRQGDKRHPDGSRASEDGHGPSVGAAGRTGSADSRSDESGKLGAEGTNRGERNGEPAGLPGAVRPGAVRRGVLSNRMGLRGLVSYIRHSKGKSLNSVAPAAIAESMDQTLSKIEKQYGSVDKFVMSELGYDSEAALYNALSADQIDGVAMAIYQMKKGQAMIIGDQTGVGKGRQMAALIRWANRQGKKPVFFTKTADLFNDLYRDMKDTGSAELRPLIINAKSKMADDNGTVYQAASDAELDSIMQSGTIPEGYDYVVLTYSQLSSGDAQSRAEKKAKTEGKSRAMEKAEFIRKIVKDNILLCDESHTAAGSGNTGIFMRSIIPSTSGVTFASATFAKRPDSMPIYALKTAISEANVGPLELIQIVKRGGVMLQEIMSRGLAKAGQMVRRQRLMDDVETEWKTASNPELAKKAKDGYNSVVSVYRDILAFTSKHGLRANLPNTFNFTRQLMLALKVDAIVEEAVSEIKAGRKPLIALENTREAALGEFAVGDEVPDATFAPALLQMIGGVEGLDEQGKRKYEELVSKIRKATASIPASPIDAITEKLEAQGYKVGEITGRTKSVRTVDGKSVVTKRSKDATGIAATFNNGKTDVLILNRSGATGISLHASEQFKDQRPRTMIIAQPLGDINEYQQMLGRIDRTGQVHRGRYVNLSLPIPAEQRFNMMLANKLKSLNANATTESDTGDINAPDLLNKYGAKVMCEYLQDNPDVFQALGIQLGYKAHPVREIEALDRYVPSADDAEKITGALALLPVEQQEAFYEDVIGRYNELIKSLDEAGLNDLKVTSMPLRAKTLSREIGTKGRAPESGNPFAQNSYVEKVEADVLTKPMTRAEIEKARREMNGENAASRVSDIIARVSTQKDTRLEAEEKRYNDALSSASEDERQAVEDRHVANVERINRIHDGIVNHLQNFGVDRTYLLHEEFGADAEDYADMSEQIGSVPGVLIGFKTPKEGKAVTPSTITAVFSTLDGRRKVEVKFSDSFILDDILAQTEANNEVAGQTTLDNWDSSIPKETREERYILTGNILQAWADASKGGLLPGKLVNYTDEDGNTLEGILMNKSWKPASDKAASVPSAPISDFMQDILDGKVIRSVDGKVQIQRPTDGYFKGKIILVVPKAVKDGGSIAKDKSVLGMVGSYGFATYNYNYKQATVNPKKLVELLKYLSESYNVRVSTESQDETPTDHVEVKNGEFSGIADRRPGEPQFAWTMRTLKALLRKYSGISENDVILSPDLLKFSSEEQDKMKNGSFNRQSKKITIFVKTNKTSADEVEKTFFHEAIHMMLDRFGWSKDSAFVRFYNQVLAASNFFEEGYQTAFENLKKRYEKAKGHEVSDAEVMEEMVTHTMSTLMQNGQIHVLIEGAKANGVEGFAEDVEKILNAINYEHSQEFNTRASAGVQSEFQSQYGEIAGGTKRNVPNSPGDSVPGDRGTAGRQASSGTSADGGGEVKENLSNSIDRAKAIVAVTELASSLGVKLKEDQSLKQKSRFSPETGTVYVNIDKHENTSDLKRSVFYAVVPAYGMDAIFGKEWKDLRMSLYENAPDSIKARIDGIAEVDHLATEVAVEEYLAQLIEDTPIVDDEEMFWNEAQSAIVALFDIFGVGHGQYAAAPEYVVYTSRRNQEKLGAIDKARQIVKSEELLELSERTQEEDDTDPEDDGPGSGLSYESPIDNAESDSEELFDVPEELADDVSDLDTDHSVDAITRETNDYIVAETAADVYERRTASPWQNMRAQLVEEYQPLLNLIRSILNWKGDVNSKDVSSLKDDERVIERLHAKASQGWHDNEVFMQDFFNPMMKALGIFIKKANKAGGTRLKMKDIVRYACLKSSLDRNEGFAKRDAKKAAKESYDKAYEKRIEELNKIEHEESARLKFKLESGLISDVTYHDEITRLSVETARLKEIAKTEHEANLANVENETAREYKRLLGMFRQNDYSALMTWFEKPSSIKRSDYPSRAAYNKAKQEAKQEFIDGVTDLASAEDMARDYVESIESRAGKDATDKLWSRINAATKETLRYQQAHGTLSRQQVRDISATMKYYLPMRGFTEETAETSYMYYLTPRGDGFAPTVLAARGRSGKKYRNPFGMIGFMHSSAVSQGLRNEAKLALLTLVRNHPTDLVTVTRTWFQKTEEVDKDGKPIFVPVYPEIPEGTATADREDIINAFEADMAELKKAGEAYNALNGVARAGGVVAFERKSHKEEHVVRVLEGGTEYGIIINGNPAAAQALNGLAKRSEFEEMALGVVDFVRNIQSRMATTYNPRFWILNFFRDTIQGVNNAFIREGFGYLGHYSVNWLRIALQIGFHVAGAEKLMEKIDPKIAGYYKEFVENGGPMRQSRIMTDEEYDRKIAKYIRYRQYDKANVVNGAYFIGNLLSSIGEATETLTRFVTYATSRDSGKPIFQSISDAKEITVNFARHGRRSYTLQDIYTWEYENGRKLYRETDSGTKIPTADALGFLLVSKLAGYFRHSKMFYNPSMQGIDNLRNNFRYHPYRSSLVAAVYTAVGFAMMLLRAGGDDDDKKKGNKASYSHTSDYYRRNNFLIPIGNGKYLRIALPQEYRPFFKLGDIMASAYLQSEPYEKLLQDAYEAIVDLGPSGVLSDEAGVVHSALPSMVVPLYEVKENKNFMGGRIYDTGYYDSNKDKPKWTWAMPTTGEGYVKVAEALNRLTGGGENNDVICGTINLNPAAIEHYINGYLSGPVNIASLVTNNIRSVRRGEPVKTKDKVVMGRLLYDVNDYDRDAYYTDMYYFFREYAKRAESIHSEFKDRDQESKQVKEFYASKPYKYMLEFQKAASSERKWKREMNEAEKNGEKELADNRKSKIQRLHEDVGRRCLEIYFKEEGSAD